MRLRLFETVGFDGAVWRFAAAHRARMAASAAELRLRFSPHAFDAALRDATPAEGASCLARLLLLESGDMRVELRPLDPLPDPVRVILTHIAVEAADPLLRHKTTRRDAYDAAWAEAVAEGADDGAIVNERGHVTETSRMTVFADTGEGRLVTPPLSEGVLPGVLRAHLLASGAAVEAVLQPGDLRSAPRLFVGNAARGLLRAVWVPNRDRSGPDGRVPPVDAGA